MPLGYAKVLEAKGVAGNVLWQVAGVLRRARKEMTEMVYFLHDIVQEDRREEATER
jgi:hypothetical protein